jgi:hypothetical protein
VLKSAEWGLMFMSANGVLIYVLMNFLAERTVGSSHREQFVTYGRSVACVMPFMLALLGVLWLSPAPLIVGGASVALGGCYYALIYRRQVVQLVSRWSAR